MPRAPNLLVRFALNPVGTCCSIVVANIRRALRYGRLVITKAMILRPLVNRWACRGRTLATARAPRGTLGPAGIGIRVGLWEHNESPGVELGRPRELRGARQGLLASESVLAVGSAREFGGEGRLRRAICSRQSSGKSRFDRDARSYRQTGPSLYGHRFGEVPWLVGVSPQCQCGAVG